MGRSSTARTRSPPVLRCRPGIAQGPGPTRLGPLEQWCHHRVSPSRHSNSGQWWGEFFDEPLRCLSGSCRPGFRIARRGWSAPRCARSPVPPHREVGRTPRSVPADRSPLAGGPFRPSHVETRPDLAGPGTGDVVGAEQDRIRTFGSLEYGLRQGEPWYRWGPYLSERQWGTVREDYSADGGAWSYLSHDRARSQAYRWGEDGLAGFSDIEQRLCLGLSLWNGRDAFLKERPFGLTGPQGNHGEDVKDYWWYVDATPSHSWNRWRYHYPQGAFPYDDLVAENGRRGKFDPEYELLDTGAFDDDRYWIVEVDYAKADPTDLLMVVRVTNAGPEADTVHVLPTAWFRNTWSWDEHAPKPSLLPGGTGRCVTEHPFLGPTEIVAAAASDGRSPRLLFCDNETNTERLYGVPSNGSPKDGINDHVLTGAETVDSERGTKAAFWYRLRVEPGETAVVRVRLRPPGAHDPWADFDSVAETRQAEADEFYAELTPSASSPDEALVLRQALAGMLWSKQLYAYEVARWLDGDPTQPPPPESRTYGRNARWRTFDAFDIMSMPDKWEYPWF